SGAASPEVGFGNLKERTGAGTATAAQTPAGTAVVEQPMNARDLAFSQRVWLALMRGSAARGSVVPPPVVNGLQISSLNGVVTLRGVVNNEMQRLSLQAGVQQIAG